MKNQENSQHRAPPSPSVAPPPSSVIDREMGEDEALALVAEKNLSAEILASIARAGIARKSRKLQFALLVHPHAPRHLLFPLLRGMFTFDLMKVALTPQIGADLKRAAEEQILVRRESLTLGERISLARRASARVAGGLLSDGDERVVSAALGNSHLREASLRAALMSGNALPILFELVSAHPTWSVNRELQMILLRNENTPIEAARRLASYFSPQALEEMLPAARRSLI